ncbi:MAG: c-type cytochrome domain-containing protein, partial [Planctomycetota bacterium]
MLGLFLGLGLTPNANADPVQPSESEVLFTRYIVPMFNESCLACHGKDPDKLKGELDMRDLKGLVKGGLSEEPAIVMGKPKESPLFLAA